MSFDTWKSICLKDLTIKIGSGSTPKGGKESYLNEGISLIRSQNVYNHTFKYEGLAYINDDQANKLKNVIIEQDDVLLNITGDSVCRCCIVPEDVLPARVNQHVSIIRCDKEKILPFFLKSYLTSPSMQAKMFSLAQGGGTRAALTKGMIENFEITLPSINEQHKIVDLLAVLDEKIKLNIEMNKVLEEIASLIFKSWFIDFEFPNEINEPYKLSNGKFVKSDLGMIPEGWEVKELSDLIEYIVDNRGKTPPFANEGIPLIEGYNIDIENSFPKLAGAKQKYVSEETYRSWFRSGHPKYLDILCATVGTLPKWCLTPKKDPLCIAQNIIGIRANKKNNSQLFLYNLLNTRYFIETFNGRIVRTAQPSIKIGHLITIPVILPKKEVIDSYTKLIDPLFMKVEVNTAQINEIKEIRDSLLPKLISGGIRLHEAEGEVEACLQKTL